MFGMQRIGDLVWAAADARARGFLLGATAGRTTLAGEGLQHCDGHNHLFSLAEPARMSGIDAPEYPEPTATASRLLDNGCLSEFRMAARSGNPLAFGGLSRQQKGLDQLTLAAHGRAGKAPVPFSLGHIRLGVEPCREQLKLCRRDLPALNAFEQMLKQRGRKILSADLRHGRQMP